MKNAVHRMAGPLAVLVLSFGFANLSEAKTNVSQLIPTNDQAADQTAGELDFSLFDQALNYSPTDLICDGQECQTLDQNQIGKNFCFSGSAKQACKTLKKLAQKTHENYLDGAHEDVQIMSCEFNLNTQKLEIVYKISEDFQMKAITTGKSIPVCHY